MYRNLVAAVLAVNGLILLTIGVLIVLSTESQLIELGLDPSQGRFERIATTFNALGMADGAASIFSFLAAVLVYRKVSAGRALALFVAANQLVVGLGLYLLTGAPAGLYFIAPRGVLIAGLAWRLPGRPE